SRRELAVVVPFYPWAIKRNFITAKLCPARTIRIAQANGVDATGPSFCIHSPRSTDEYIISTAVIIYDGRIINDRYVAAPVDAITINARRGNVGSRSKIPVIHRWIISRETNANAESRA